MRLFEWLTFSLATCFTFSFIFFCYSSVFLDLSSRPWSNLFDCKIFFTLDRDTCFARRQARIYDPPDSPGFFDQCVWPMYLENKNNMDANNVIEVDGTMHQEEIFNLLVNCINSIQVWWCRERKEAYKIYSHEWPGVARKGKRQWASLFPIKINSGRVNKSLYRFPCPLSLSLLTGLQLSYCYLQMLRQGCGTHYEHGYN